MGQPADDPMEFLKRLRTEHRILQWEPLEPDQVRKYKESEQVRSRESLEYLHHHWVLPDHVNPEDAGGGIRGRVVTLFGRMTFRVLRRYLRCERDLLAHMVRVNEALEQRCDELTLRVQQLNQDIVDRQVDEARKLAELAAWLHRESSTRSAPNQGEEAGNRESRSQ